GSVSVFQKFKNQQVTAEMLGLEGKSKNPVQVIIDDGCLVKNALDSIGMGKGWLNGVLSDRSVTINEVFLLTADESGAFNLIKKEGKA
ncbi:MAG: YetF domain-containing protein, partial [Oscillospiraceae bacterium]